MPRVHLVNPSTRSFGVAVITPRWLYVLAAATGTEWGDPNIIDETLDPVDFDVIAAGDVVGIGIHTGNALRGYEIGRQVRERGAWVVFGGIHATLFPDEAVTHGSAHAVVRGDGDLIWARVVKDCLAGAPLPVYEGGRIDGDQFASARWDLLPDRRYMWASVQTVRGCPKHCSFCSVWRTDGQEPRQRAADRVVREIVELRRRGFRFIALADDNFYPVTFEDLAQAKRRSDPSRLHELEALREERFALMARLAALPEDLVFYTQITMEAAEDPQFLDAMKRARILGALVGVESVTRDGLNDIYKGFNLAGDELVARLRAFRRHGIHVLGSFIFGLPSDTEQTFDATVALAEQADLAVSRDRRLRQMGRRGEPPRHLDRRRADHAALADPGGTAPAPVRRASDDVAGADPRGHAAGVGPLLQHQARLGALARRPERPRANRVRAHLEAVPADVRQYRHRDRQRARPAIGALGAVDRHGVPAPLPRKANARSEDTWRSAGGRRQLTAAVTSRRRARFDDPRSGASASAAGTGRSRTTRRCNNPTVRRAAR